MKKLITTIIITTMMTAKAEMSQAEFEKLDAQLAAHSAEAPPMILDMRGYNIAVRVGEALVPFVDSKEEIRSRENVKHFRSMAVLFGYSDKASMDDFVQTATDSAEESYDLVNE